MDNINNKKKILNQYVDNISDKIDYLLLIEHGASAIYRRLIEKDYNFHIIRYDPCHNKELFENEYYEKKIDDLKFMGKYLKVGIFVDAIRTGTEMQIVKKHCEKCKYDVKSIIAYKIKEDIVCDINDLFPDSRLLYVIKTDNDLQHKELLKFRPSKELIDTDSLVSKIELKLNYYYDIYDLGDILGELCKELRTNARDYFFDEDDFFLFINDKLDLVIYSYSIYDVNFENYIIPVVEIVFKYNISESILQFGATVNGEIPNINTENKTESQIIDLSMDTSKKISKLLESDLYLHIKDKLSL